jgi:aldose sugar dehydrogenase
LWQNEHGENNGDEINIIQGGGNFGWPIATWGVDYRTGQRFAPTPPEVADTVDPVYWWEPDHPEGFPPSGLAFYDGDAFAEWQGNMFMGNLRHQYLGRFSVNGTESRWRSACSMARAGASATSPSVPTMAISTC